VVIALAGRRIDAPAAAAPRFPAENVALVRQRLRKLFVENGASALACSAACGADLIALDVAGELKLRRRIVLPFDVARFRETSVTDRPGQWGQAFDRAIAETGAAGDLVIVNSSSDDAGYAAANQAVLDEAGTLRKETGVPAAAVIVWNGQSLGPDDYTAQFRDLAARRGLQVFEVSTV
jgi:hypothetical protein